MPAVAFEPHRVLQGIAAGTSSLPLSLSHTSSGLRKLLAQQFAANKPKICVFKPGQYKKKENSPTHQLARTHTAGRTAHAVTYRARGGEESEHSRGFCYQLQLPFCITLHKQGIGRGGVRRGGRRGVTSRWQGSCRHVATCRPLWSSTLRSPLQP